MYAEALPLKNTDLISRLLLFSTEGSACCHASPNPGPSYKGLATLSNELGLLVSLKIKGNDWLPSGNEQTASFGAWLGWEFAQSPKHTHEEGKKTGLSEYHSNPVASQILVIFAC